MRAASVGMRLRCPVAPSVHDLDLSQALARLDAEQIPATRSAAAWERREALEHRGDHVLRAPALHAAHRLDRQRDGLHVVLDLFPAVTRDRNGAITEAKV